jgi:signal peptidase I
MNNDDSKKNDKEKKDFFLPIVIIICIFNVLFNMFFFQLAFVHGTSMSPTLKPEQLLIINKISDIETYERGDVVIFDANGKKLIKRLIAFPNEKVQIIDNNIYINEEKIDDYVNVKMKDYGCLKEQITLKENEYIFLGDNRNNSLDCRDLGPIKKENIIGKIIFRFFPLDTEF